MALCAIERQSILSAMPVKLERSDDASGAPPPDDDRGAGQRRRTRTALLANAAQLVARGQLPSVADVADAADVSRRTAYRYFPTQEQMLAEASLEALRPQVESALAAALSDTAGLLDDVGQARARLEAAVKVMHRLTLEHEPLLRTMIRLTAGRTSGPPPERGSRRVDWITSAVSPVKPRLGARRFERLVSALTSCVGMDSLFLLRDARGLSARSAERVMQWTARALLDASVAEAGASDA
jgi:AcrR family transcriptional regulator